MHSSQMNSQCYLHFFHSLSFSLSSLSSFTNTCRSIIVKVICIDWREFSAAIQNIFYLCGFNRKPFSHLSDWATNIETTSQIYKISRVIDNIDINNTRSYLNNDYLITKKSFPYIWVCYFIRPRLRTVP